MSELLSTEAIVAQLRALDLETHKVQPGLLAPPMVVGSTAKVAPGTEQLLSPSDVMSGFKHCVERTDDILAGAHIAYDFGVIAAEAERQGDPTVLPLIFRLYEERRVCEVLLYEALDAIARGHLFRQADGTALFDPGTGKKSKKYSLDIVTHLETGRVDAKKNSYWRLRYAILQGVPWKDWPFEARQYPLDDARNSVDDAAALLRRGARNVGDLPAQAETAFGLHLGAMWGFRTSRERTEALAARADAAHAASVAKFTRLGFLRANGTKDTSAIKRAVAIAYGVDPASRCPLCGGWGRVSSPGGGGSTVACPVPAEGGCDGTALDLSTSTTLANLLTKSGGISTSRDTLVESGDEDLADFAENPWEKIRQTYVPYLRQGYDRPINLRPNALVESGRTSYEDPSQTFPRKHGVRNCVQAREGYYFLSVDYAAIELCCFAQVCYTLFGHSSMRDIINSTGDPGQLHTALGGRLIGKPLEEMRALVKGKGGKLEIERAKNARQGAKPWNFGALGGMGAAKFVLNQRSSANGSTKTRDGKEYPGVRFCILLGGEMRCGRDKSPDNIVTSWNRRSCPPICRRCVEIVEYMIKPAWLAEFPEVQEYFSWIKWMTETYGEIPAFGPVDRVRGGLGFTDGANTCFQSLNADGGKYAWRQVIRACYLKPESPLWGTRPILFAHDEIFAETPIWKSHAAGYEMARVMVECMREYVPDVTVRAEPALMEFWYKEAETVVDERGILQPWRPEEKMAA